jgi:general stress protein 26
MSTNHLRNQAGGNPAQGPHPDVANPAPGPAAGEDFPDRPDERVAERPQDQPDLDAFAQRMGTDQLAGRSGVDSGTGRERRDWRAPMSTALGGLAAGARSVGDRLKGVSEKLVARDDGAAALDLADLRARVGKIRTVMVTTVDERGTLSARPLTVQHLTETGDVHFVVDRDAEWVVTSMDAVNVAFVDGSSTWVSVAGRGVVDDDTRLLDDLWNPALDSFFPDGRATAVVVRVQADRWEYWTAPNKISQLIEIAKSRISDDRPDLGDSGVVET